MLSTVSTEQKLHSTWTNMYSRKHTELCGLVFNSQVFPFWPREILAVLRCAGMTRCRIILGRWLLWKSCNIAQKSTLGTLKEKLKYSNLCSMITSWNTKEYVTVQVCVILNAPKYAYWEIQRGKCLWQSLTYPKFIRTERVQNKLFWKMVTLVKSWNSEWEEASPWQNRHTDFCFALAIVAKVLMRWCWLVID